jgi:hypothetical protein
MKKILFIGILVILSSAPAYPAAGGNSAGHASGGPQTGVIPSNATSSNTVAPQPNAISNKAVTPPRHHKKVHIGGAAVVQEIPPMEAPRHHLRHSGVVQLRGGSA